MPNSSSKAKPKQFFGAPEGTATLTPKGIRITSRFTPERLAVLRKVKGAKFDRTSCSWTVPINCLEQVRRQRCFNSGIIHYRFGDLREAPSATQIEAANQALLADPFEVPQPLCYIADCDLIVKRAKQSPAIIIIPRYGSPAEPFIRKESANAYIDSEKGYCVPTERLADTLRAAKANKFSYAIEESVGKQLKQGASIRKAIVQGSIIPDKSALLDAGLVPILALQNAGSENFMVEGALPYHLRALFPSLKSYSERVRAAKNIDRRAMYRLLWDRLKLPFPIYLETKANDWLNADRSRALEEIIESADGFDQTLLSNASIKFAWVTLAIGAAGLLIDPSLEPDLASLLGISNATKEQFVDKRLFYSWKSAEIQEIEEQIAHRCDELRIAPPPKSRQFKDLLAMNSSDLAARRETASLRKLKDVKAEIFGTNAEIAERLYPHQRVALKFVLEREHCFLGDDMGLGKTLSLLTAFAILKSRGETQLMLVCCPRSLVGTWTREASRWFPKLRTCATPRDRDSRNRTFRLLARKEIVADIIIVHYEALRLDGMEEQLRKLIEQFKVLLCVDEAQRVKNPRGKTFQCLAKLAPLCSRRTLLSGTPIPKDLSDIWSQMFILDGGARFGTKFMSWLNEIAELGTKFSPYAVRRYKHDGVQRTIQKVQEVLLRRTKEEVLTLPEKTFSIREVELQGDQAARYREICEELRVRLSTTSGDTFTRELSNILEEYLRAVQVASNPRLIDTQWKGQPAKFLELDEIIAEIVTEREEKLVVWTNYLGNIKELFERYKHLEAATLSGEDTFESRERTIKSFQEQLIPKILIAVPAAGGVGITLTAAQTAVYMDKTWNAEHWVQSVDRIHRIGQSGTVSIISLNASPVDALIERNLAKKCKLQRELLGDLDLRSKKRSFHSADLTRQELLDALVESD